MSVEEELFHSAEYLLWFSCCHVWLLWPHRQQQDRFPCSSLSPRACWNSYPLSHWWMPSSHLILCHLLLPVPSVFPSIRVFSNKLALCISWPYYWSFSFSINPSNEYSGFVSIRTDWFDLLAVQGTLKSLLQHHNSKASILWCSTFFMVQLTHLYVNTGKNYDCMDLCQQSGVSAF